MLHVFFFCRIRHEMSTCLVLCVHLFAASTGHKGVEGS
uniref:Uncharacterized protein n=1 Tax=Setaria italica TaxID=4555 RepID=K3XU67_SETIT